MLEIGEYVPLGRSGPQLRAYCREVVARIVTSTKSKATEWRGEFFRSDEFVALCDAKSGAMALQHCIRFSAEPGFVPELESEPQPELCGFLQKGREPGNIGFHIRRQLEQDQAHAIGFQSGSQCDRKIAKSLLAVF